MAEQLKDYNYQFIDAIVPVSYPDSYNTRKRLRYYAKPMPLGEVGCYLSHRKIWELFLNTTHSYVVVVEDDVELKKNFIDVVKKITSLKSSAHFIRLHGIFTRKVKKLESLVVDNETYWLCDLHKQPAGTGAYIIFREGALRLLEYTKEIYLPIDEAIDRDWENNLNILMIQPNIAAISKNFSSTISRPKIQIGFFRKILRELYRSKQATRKAIHILLKLIRWRYG